MPTYQIRCVLCRKRKWPDLPDRPIRYVCALCRAVTPTEGLKRRETAQRASDTKKARRGVSGDRTGASSP